MEVKNKVTLDDPNRQNQGLFCYATFFFPFSYLRTVTSTLALTTHAFLLVKRNFFMLNELKTTENKWRKLSILM